MSSEGVGCGSYRWALASSHRWVRSLSRRCRSPTRQGVGLLAWPLKCQSHPSCQKLSDWLAWMSGYPHGSRPARVRRFKTPTATAKLRVLHRSLARKKQGGKNRRKALLLELLVRVQRQQEQVANQCRDYLHKLSADRVGRPAGAQ